VSLCISQWFYTPEKEEGNTVSVARNMAIILIKHAGTAASGSLLITPICLLRSPILFLQSCIKRSGADNTCIDAIICCCQCGLFVLERFLKFANKMVYHHTSLFGTSFCKSSHETHYLMCRNEEFLKVAGSVRSFSVFFLKAFTISSASLASFALLDVYYKDAINNIVSVTVVIAIMTSFIAGFFADILGETVSTLLYCYMADEEIMGMEGSPFVTPEFYDFLDFLNESEDFGENEVEYTGEGVEVGIPKKIDMY
jgi:solute carrier family 44 protein 1 (choline transporter-like protein)